MYVYVTFINRNDSNYIPFHLVPYLDFFFNFIYLFIYFYFFNIFLYSRSLIFT